MGIFQITFTRYFWIKKYHGMILYDNDKRKPIKDVKEKIDNYQKECKI